MLHHRQIHLWVLLPVVRFCFTAVTIHSQSIIEGIVVSNFNQSCFALACRRQLLHPERNTKFDHPFMLSCFCSCCNGFCRSHHAKCRTIFTFSCPSISVALLWSNSKIKSSAFVFVSLILHYQSKNVLVEEIGALWRHWLFEEEKTIKCRKRSGEQKEQEAEKQTI